MFCSLILSRATLKDSGIYVCQVRYGLNTVPQIDRRITVKIISARDIERSLGTPEDNEVDSKDYDDYDLSEEEALQKKEDEKNACSNLPEKNANETYLCIDLENKKEMSHYQVRPAGGSATLYCHVKGTKLSFYCPLKGFD